VVGSKDPRAECKTWNAAQWPSVIPCAPMYLPNHFENADLPVVPGAILGNSHPFARREFDAEIARCPEGFYCTHMRALKRSDFPLA
jgi:hypothetical protein